jgi:hypothetical protein
MKLNYYIEIATLIQRLFNIKPDINDTTENISFTLNGVKFLYIHNMILSEQNTILYELYSIYEEIENTWQLVAEENIKVIYDLFLIKAKNEMSHTDRN